MQITWEPLLIALFAKKTFLNKNRRIFFHSEKLLLFKITVQKDRQVAPLTSRSNIDTEIKFLQISTLVQKAFALLHPISQKLSLLGRTCIRILLIFICRLCCPSVQNTIRTILYSLSNERILSESCPPF